MFTTICDPILENHPYRSIFDFWAIIIIIIITWQEQ